MRDQQHRFYQENEPYFSCMSQRGGGRHRFQGRDGGHNGFGGGGLPRGRKFASDELQLLLLALIAETPSHGYELIKILETRSNGFYAPSPGMVYPALTYLEELEHVTATLQGNRKCYSISKLGESYLTANREQVDVMLEKLSHMADRMDSVRRAYAGEETSESCRFTPELANARRELKSAVLEAAEQSATEQRRIADILLQAITDIRAKAGE